MPRKLGLAALLVERGLFADAKTASAWIMARKVRVGSDYVTQPGLRVAADVAVEVLGREQRYVGRGGEKLEGALDGFAVSVAGLVVLDAGASTGGFTDCLLAHGAARVYAVDVGFGQLRGKLASDPRVVPLERTNIGDLDLDRFDPSLDLCTADLSYLSVAKSLPILAALFAGEPRVIHLLKPLFEGVSPEQATERAVLREMLERVTRHAAAAGLALTRVQASPILGNSGTVEFFGLLERAGTAPAAPLAEQIEDALTLAGVPGRGRLFQDRRGNVSSGSAKAYCVFCGSSPGARPEYREHARRLGEDLARRGIRLVYGGADVGLMGTLADAALAVGGGVTGVIPTALVEFEVAHRNVEDLRVVSSMHERKQLMADLSDGFIALPGGYGTLEELLEILTWAQLGAHTKPVALLNVSRYFDPLLAMLDHAVAERFLSVAHREMLIVARTPAELLDRMDAYHATPGEKWLDRPAR